MLVGIDAGHGINTSGKRCDKRYDKNQTREWSLNSKVANYVQSYLKDYDVSTIRLDDTTGKTDISLSKRCNTANNKKCDLVVSIHHNAGGGNGLESYVWNGLPSTSRTIKIGQTIHNACIKATGQRDRGLKKADFAIIRDTYMDAVLIEGGFMDHPEDTPRILTDDFAKKYARGIVNGIAEYYKLKKKETPKEATYKAGTKYYLKNSYLYTSATAKDRVKSVTGNYYLWSGEVVNKRIRITNKPANVGRSGQVTGWINVIDIENKNVVTNTTQYYKKYTGKSGSIVEALNSIGVNSSYSNRAKIAKKNGIKLYVGTAKQNTTLLNLLKQGKLAK